MIVYCKITKEKKETEFTHAHEIYEILTQLTFDIDQSVLPKSLTLLLC